MASPAEDSAAQVDSAPVADSAAEPDNAEKPFVCVEATLKEKGEGEEEEVEEREEAEEEEEAEDEADLIEDSDESLAVVGLLHQASAVVHVPADEYAMNHIDRLLAEHQSQLHGSSSSAAAAASGGGSGSGGGAARRGPRCEDCSDGVASFGLTADGSGGDGGSKRWCVRCAKARPGSVRIGSASSSSSGPVCEDCGLKTPHYGFKIAGALKQHRRWCGPCARVGHPGATNLSEQKCEICDSKQASFVLPPSTRKQWCAGCAGKTKTKA